MIRHSAATGEGPEKRRGLDDPAVAASADRVITLNSLVPVSPARSAEHYGLFR